jgi:hypothetical protein
MPFLDIYPYVLKSIVDTVFIPVMPKQDPNWYKFIMPLVGLFGIVVGMVGWWMNSWYARRNQLKGFEESVLDKIRIEMNFHFVEYEKWLNALSSLIELHILDDGMRANLRYQEIKKQKDAVAVYEAASPEKQAVYAQKPTLEVSSFKLNVSRLENFTDKASRPEFYTRFEAYDILFSNFLRVVNLMKARHNDLTISVIEFTSNYIHGIIKFDEAYNPLVKLRIKAAEASSLRFQLFQFFQFECLKTLDRILVPNFESSPYNYLHRNKDGTLSIEPTRITRIDSTIEE